MAGGATSALGTLTVVEQIKSQGPVRVTRFTLVGDADYATGGTAGLLAKVKEKLVSYNENIVAVIDQSVAAATYLVYDHTNNKLVAFVRTTGVEVAAGTDLHATTFDIVVISG